MRAAIAKLPLLLGAAILAAGRFADAAGAGACVSSACGHKVAVVKIADAENSIFTSEGRVFISGGTHVYLLDTSSAGIVAEPWSPAGNFTGLAQIGATVYAMTFDGVLHASRDGGFFVPIQQLSAMHAANGMVAGPGGELYVVNGPLSSNTLPDPKIVRVRLDPADPLHVVGQTTWLTDRIKFPNGLARRGNTLYFTDSRSFKPALGLIRAVDILADGSAGTPRDVAHFPGIPDDLSFDGDDFVVALYSNGAVVRYGSDGHYISQINPGTFAGPSSARIGRIPGTPARPGDLQGVVVTEKGVVGDNYTPIGKVSVFVGN